MAAGVVSNGSCASGDLVSARSSDGGSLASCRSSDNSSLVSGDSSDSENGSKNTVRAINQKPESDGSWLQKFILGADRVPCGLLPWQNIIIAEAIDCLSGFECCVNNHSLEFRGDFNVDECWNVVATDKNPVDEMFLQIARHSHKKSSWYHGICRVVSKVKFAERQKAIGVKLYPWKAVVRITKTGEQYRMFVEAPKQTSFLAAKLKPMSIAAGSCVIFLSLPFETCCAMFKSNEIGQLNPFHPWNKE